MGRILFDNNMVEPIDIVYGLIGDLANSFRHPEIANLFREVDPTFYLQNDPASQDFLVRAIYYHNIDTSDLVLAGLPSLANSFTVFSHKVTKEEIRVLNLGMRTSDFKDPADVRFVILHELRHVEQDRLGLFSETRETKVDPKSTDLIAYNSLPHEFDANRFAISSPLALTSYCETSTIVELTKNLMKERSKIAA